MITKLAIIIVFAVMVVYDIWAKASGKQPTITKWFRKWFKSLPVIPYSIGFLFIGHFGVPIVYPIPDCVKLLLFIWISLAYIIYNLLSKVSKSEHKLWLFQCKHWYLVMLVGVVVGSLWDLK